MVTFQQLRDARPEILATAAGTWTDTATSLGEAGSTFESEVSSVTRSRTTWFGPAASVANDQAAGIGRLTTQAKSNLTFVATALGSASGKILDAQRRLEQLIADPPEGAVIGADGTVAPAAIAPKADPDVVPLLKIRNKVAVEVAEHKIEAILKDANAADRAAANALESASKAQATLAVAAQEAENLGPAEEEFFGPTPDGAQRRIIQTDAKVPGGKDGIIVMRGYIPTEHAAFGTLKADDRGPSTDPSASSRFAVAWDTRTGEVSITVHPSTQEFYRRGIPLPPEEKEAYPINIGQDSLGTSGHNNFAVNVSEPGKLDISYDLLNSGLPEAERIGAVQGRISLAVDEEDNKIIGQAFGENYPNREVIQYGVNGSRFLDRKSWDGGWMPEWEVMGGEVGSGEPEWTKPR